MNSMPKRKKPPDPALAVKIISSMLCFPLCSNCPENYGSHLPCSAMGRSVLGRYSTFVRFPWLIKSLKPRSFPSSPASPAVCDDLARDGCRRPSVLVIVAIARARGSRSALLKMFAQGWHLRSRASFTGAANLVKVEQFGLFAANDPSVGIETGLALCFLQCKQFPHSSLGTLVVTNCSSDAGWAQKAFASLSLVGMNYRLFEYTSKPKTFEHTIG